MRAFNFSPGPCGLPSEVMIRAQEEFCEYRDEQASIMEISHRGRRFMEVYQNAELLLRELLNIPKNYWVLFLQGGASGQSAAVPLNLLGDNRRTAGYAVTGHWSLRTATEAKKYCNVHLAASGEMDGFCKLPSRWDIPEECAYLHYADNETIHGVEFQSPPSSPSPLVADMSSNIASRPLEVSEYGLIYAGAQKNLGPTGVTVVIVREDLVNARADVPMVWDYRRQAERESMLNTPPTFQIYMVGLVLEWLKAKGGIAEIAAQNKAKAGLLYECIDEGDFYKNKVFTPHRSRMNAPFFLADDSLTDEFLSEAQTRGLIGLKGHAVLGGCRASLYNAMSLEGVRALTDFMRDFARRRG